MGAGWRWQSGEKCGTCVIASTIRTRSDLHGGGHEGKQEVGQGSEGCDWASLTPAWASGLSRVDVGADG